MGAEKITKIVPIILAGGNGSRLWPLSRKSFPKQFLDLLDDKYTLLQKTYKRIENLEDVSRPIIICNEEHRFIVGHQMKDMNVEPLSIILEPEGRNTTPAITIAALKAIEDIAERYSKLGKQVKLRHLTKDCHSLLRKTGQLIVDSDDDPDYGIAVDYGVKLGIFGK